MQFLQFPETIPKLQGSFSYFPSQASISIEPGFIGQGVGEGIAGTRVKEEVRVRVGALVGEVRVGTRVKEGDGVLEEELGA